MYRGEVLQEGRCICVVNNLNRKGTDIGAHEAVIQNQPKTWKRLNSEEKQLDKKYNPRYQETDHEHLSLHCIWMRNGEQRVNAKIY